MDDLISREDAIDAIYEHEFANWCDKDEVSTVLNDLPSAQPEIKQINYRDCANAMLKMWLDDVVTDGEYCRIMDKLNKHELERLNNG